MAYEQAVLRDDGTIEFHDDPGEEPPTTWRDLREFATAYDVEQMGWNKANVENGPATEFMIRLAYEAPSWAVDFLRQLVVLVDASSVASLGCGALEDLTRHDSLDPARIEAIEIAAQQIPAFQKALSNVWLNEDLPEDVRVRLSRLGARDFVAEGAMDENERAAYVEYRDSNGWDWG